MGDIERLSKRFWREAERDFSPDIGEIAISLVSKLEDKINKLEEENDKAIELLKEFAFYCIDDSVEDHCDRAVKVQEFLKTTKAKSWIETQLRLAKCDNCEMYDDCEHHDGYCE